MRRWGGDIGEKIEEEVEVEKEEEVEERGKEEEEKDSKSVCCRRSRRPLEKC